MSDSPKAETGDAEDSVKPGSEKILDPKRPAIIAAAALALLLFVVAALVQTGSGATQKSSSLAASSSAVAASSSASATETDQASSDAKNSSSSSSAVSASAEKTVAYKVGEDGQLRFVDKDNLAHTFDEYATRDGLPIVAPSISTGTFVDAFSQTDSHKIDGREYRDLDNKYLNTLKADVEAYRQNPQTSFKATQNERLQIPMDAYSAFVALLSNSDVLDQVVLLTLVADGTQVASDASTTYAGPTVPSGADRAAASAAAQREAEAAQESGADIWSSGAEALPLDTTGISDINPEEADTSVDTSAEVSADATTEIPVEDNAYATYPEDTYDGQYSDYTQGEDSAYEYTYTDYGTDYGTSDIAESPLTDTQ